MSPEVACSVELASQLALVLLGIEDLLDGQLLPLRHPLERFADADRLGDDVVGVARTTGDPNRRSAIVLRFPTTRLRLPP
jgi:hypothetical protein